VHAQDQGQRNRSGHAGSDGSSSWQRLERYGRWSGVIGENISYGAESARAAVVNLVIDDGVPGRGHRLDLFEPRYRLAGAAFGPHPYFGSICVIELAQYFEPWIAAGI
jgi:uncharacterized protein YkwD